MSVPITLVVTAMDRLDLLETTLKSFLKYNHIEKMLIRDDSGLEDVFINTKHLLESLGVNYQLLPKGNLGQIKSIDTLMNEIKTDLYFFLEEDWEFHRGVIKDCLKIIDKNTLQVRVRNLDDGSAARLGEQQIKNNVLYAEVLSHRFSFNPYLGQTKFYTPYEDIPINVCLEHSLDNHGLKVYSLINGGCRHIGSNKPCNRPNTPYNVAKA